MYTLSQILQVYEHLGYDDLGVIREYLKQDGVSAEAIKMLIESLANKMHKLETERASINAWMAMPTAFYYRDYDIDTAMELDLLTRRMQLNLPFTKGEVEYMKKVKLKDKAPCWHDLAEAIKAIQDETYKPEWFNPYTVWDKRGKDVDQLYMERADGVELNAKEVENMVVEELKGKVIKEADVNGFGLDIEFEDGTFLTYDASDGGYSSWDLLSCDTCKYKDAQFSVCGGCEKHSEYEREWKK